MYEIEDSIADSKEFKEIEKEEQNKEMQIIKFKRIYIVLGLIIILAFALRAYHINYPFLDHHQWKQSEVAFEAHNFYTVKYNIFYPLVTAHTHLPGEKDRPWNEKPGLHYIEEIFPIVPFLAATLYFIFGEQPWVARIVIIFFSIATIPYLYRLSRLYFNERVSYIAALVYAIVPLSVFFGRAFQEESAMVFFSVAGLYYYHLWIEKEKRRDFWLGGCFIALAILAKLNALYLGLPMMYLLYKKHKWHFLKNKKVYAMLILVLLPTVLWYAHTRANLYSESGISIVFGNTRSLQSLIKGDFENVSFLHYPFYKNIVSEMYGVMLTPIGFVLFFLGLAFSFIKYKKEGLNFFHWWLISVIISFLIISDQVQRHDYYKIILVPVAAVFIGYGLDRLYSFSLKVEEKSYKLGKIVYILMLVILYLSIKIYLPPLFMINTYIQSLGNAINQITSEDDLIITALYGDDPEVLYASGYRRGWGYWAGDLNPKALESMREMGAKYLVHLLPEYLQKDENTTQYMVENYDVGKLGDYVFIFDLRQKKSEARQKNESLN